MRDAYPGLGFDPAPGEPTAVEAVLAQLSDGATGISSLADELARAVRPGGWRGAAASAFHTATAPLPGALSDLAVTVAAAHRTLTTWQAQLSANKREADQLDLQARQLAGSDREPLVAQARRLLSRHLRQARAAAQAIRGLPFAWAGGDTAKTSAQVSLWSAHLATLIAGQPVPALTGGEPVVPGQLVPALAGQPVPALAGGQPVLPGEPVMPGGPPPPLTTLLHDQSTSPALAEGRPLPLTDLPGRPLQVAESPDGRPAGLQTAGTPAAGAPARSRLPHNPPAPRALDRPRSDSGGAQPHRSPAVHHSRPEPNDAHTRGPGRPSAGHAPSSRDDNRPDHIAPSSGPLPDVSSPANASIDSSTHPGGSYSASSGTGFPASANPGSTASPSSGYQASSNPGYLDSSTSRYPISPINSSTASPSAGYPASSNSGYPASAHNGYPASGNSGYPASGSNSSPASANNASSANSGNGPRLGSSPAVDADTGADPDAENGTDSDLGVTAMAFGAVAGTATHAADNLPATFRGYLLGHPDRRPVLALFLTHPTRGRVRVFVPCGAFDSPGNAATPPAPATDLLAASERNT